MDSVADSLTGRVIILPGITIPILLLLCIVLAAYYSCKKDYAKPKKIIKDEEFLYENEDETELMGDKSQDNESAKPVIVATYKKHGSEGFEQVSINITPADKTDSESENDEEHDIELQQISHSVDED